VSRRPEGMILIMMLTGEAETTGSEARFDRYMAGWLVEAALRHNVTARLEGL
jgi:hypothetical protein